MGACAQLLYRRRARRSHDLLAATDATRHQDFKRWAVTLASQLDVGCRLCERSCS